DLAVDHQQKLGLLHDRQARADRLTRGSPRAACALLAAVKNGSLPTRTAPAHRGATSERGWINRHWPYPPNKIAGQGLPLRLESEMPRLVPASLAFMALSVLSANAQSVEE